MHFTKVILSALIPSALVLAASPARANCARPVGYEASVTANSVQVEPINFDSRVCPDPGGMLRQTVGTGDIVKLADFCMSGLEVSAYVDECVPPGTYRYGFATPYDCEQSACDTSYFVEAVVTDALPGGCAPSAGNPGPTSATSVPWQDNPVICSYNENTGGTGGSGGSGGSGGNGETGGSGGSGGKGTSTGDGGNGNTQDSSGGCSIALGSGAAPVIGANAIALLAGIGLMRRRRAAEKR